MNSLRQVIHHGIEILDRGGNQSARTEVEQILMHLLACSRMDLYLGKELSDRLDYGAFEQLILQRAKKIPLQYLLGESYFYSWQFKVGPGVFIPRPETEILVQQCVRLFETVGAMQASPLHLLDLGTGSGNIAIALTKLLSYCKISAIEISSVALAAARENARRHGVENQLEFIQEDWSQFLRRSRDRVDGIIANPPYIPSGEIPQLDLEVRMESRQALDGGADGLGWIRILLREAGNVLKEEGRLVFEMGKGQGETVKGIARRQGWKEFGVANDLNGIERVFWAKKKKGTGFRVQRAGKPLLNADRCTLNASKNGSSCH